jgi:hypothetical protein
MKFTVTWTEQAKKELCKLFMAVPDRGELSRIVNSLEQELARRPESLGESRDGNVRVVMESHFGIMIEVHPNDCLVKVFHIGWLP